MWQISGITMQTEVKTLFKLPKYPILIRNSVNERNVIIRIFARNSEADVSAFLQQNMAKDELKHCQTAKISTLMEK